jgi:outer membrane phospholipase A
VSTYLHVQFFAGYGESILEYNVRRKSQLRFGFAIVP